MYVTQVQQQRPESPTVTLTWHACKYKVHKPFEDVPLVEFMYHAFQMRVTVGDPGIRCCILLRISVFVVILVLRSSVFVVILVLRSSSGN